MSKKQITQQEIDELLKKLQLEIAEEKRWKEEELKRQKEEEKEEKEKKGELLFIPSIDTILNDVFSRYDIKDLGNILSTCYSMLGLIKLANLDLNEVLNKYSPLANKVLDKFCQTHDVQALDQLMPKLAPFLGKLDKSGEIDHPLVNEMLNKLCDTYGPEAVKDLFQKHKEDKGMPESVIKKVEEISERKTEDFLKHAERLLENKPYSNFTFTDREKHQNKEEEKVEEKKDLEKEEPSRPSLSR